MECQHSVLIQFAVIKLPHVNVHVLCDHGVHGFNDHDDYVHHDYDHHDYDRDVSDHRDVHVLLCCLILSALPILVIVIGQLALILTDLLLKDLFNAFY